MKTNFDRSMNEFLDLPEENEENNKQLEIIEKTENDIGKLNLNDDYEKIRENLLELLDTGKEAIDDMLTIARETEKSKDFETVAILMKTVVEANQSVIDMHKKIREIANYKQNNSSDTKIQNALFVGSTTELSKMLKELNNQEKEVN